MLAGQTTPVFFGSGINNFGVQLLLDGFLKHSPPPKPRVMAGTEISPENPAFSGFFGVAGSLFLQKPFGRSELMECVRNALAKS